MGTASSKLSEADDNAEQGNHAGAIAALSEAIRLRPDYAKAYFKRGVSKQTLGDYAGAIVDYTEAIRLWAYKQAQGEYVGAMLEYNKAVQMRNNLHAQGESKSAYALVLPFKSNYAEAYNNRGASKHAQGDNLGAIADFTNAIFISNHDRARFNPGYSDSGEQIRIQYYCANPYYRRGVSKQAQGDDVGAIADYTEALRFYPNYALAYYNRGTAKHAQGDYPGAIADYTEAIRFYRYYEHPHYALYNRGISKHAQGDYAGAIADYTKAIQLKINDPHMHEKRGLSKHAAGDYLGALIDYSEAIRLKPDFTDAFIGRANTYEALELHPKSQNDRYQAKLIQRDHFPEVQLYEAISRGQQIAALGFLTLIRKQNPDISVIISTPMGEELALLVLARFGHTTWLPDFLRHLRLDITDAQGNWALHAAAQGGHVEFFDALLDQNILPDRVGGGYEWPSNLLGETPIHAAAIAGQTRFLIYCHQTYNAELDLQAVTAIGDNLIHLMVRNNQVVALEQLLDSINFLSVRHQNLEGYDPLMLALSLPRPQAEYQQLSKLLALLLNKHIDLANRDRQGRTALHLAVQSGVLDIVAKILLKGPNIDVIDAAGNKPEDYVSENSDIGLLLNQHKRALRNQRQHFKQTFREYRNLVFQGGSVKGLAYPAALRSLVEEGVCSLDKIQRIGGTSAGAITALLLGLDYSLDEIEHLTGVKTLAGSKLPQVQFAQLLDGPFGTKILQQKNHNWSAQVVEIKDIAQKLSSINGILNGLRRYLDGSIGKALELFKDAKKEFGQQLKQLNQTFGLCPGDKLYELFDELTRAKLAERVPYLVTTPVTFEELEKAGFKKFLYFVGVNISSGEAEYFSHEHTPTMLVANAVRISMAIPGVFYPVAKAVKDKNGQIQIGKELYVDGGVSLNYPIKLFDFARYGDDQHLPRDLPQINQSTLGLRLVSSQLKARYENLTELEELIPQAPPVHSLLNYIKETLSAIYNKQESDHVLNGDGFRSIYIDTLDVNTLDFERVEETATKKLLALQGAEGVRDFIRRVRLEADSRILLPKALEQAYLKYTDIVGHQVEHGQHKVITQLKPNCPGLIVDFYNYEDLRLHHYLHHDLNISLWVRDTLGMTAFHLAAIAGNITALKRLLQIAPEGASALNSAGQMPHQLVEVQQYPLILALLTEIADQHKDKQAPITTPSSILAVTGARRGASMKHRSYPKAIPDIPFFLPEINKDKQLGWNCFDVAIGLSRQALISFALQFKNDLVFRKLLAPEIKTAAAITAIMMNMSAEGIEKSQIQNKELCELSDLLDVAERCGRKEEVEKVFLHIQEKLQESDENSSTTLKQAALPISMHTKEIQDLMNAYNNAHEAIKPELAECNNKLGNLEGNRQSFSQLRNFFSLPSNCTQYEEAYNKFNEALRKFISHEKALDDYCESEKTYEAYINGHYGNKQWVSFIPTSSGQQNTSIVDIAARAVNKKIIIHQLKNKKHEEIYRTEHKGDGIVHIQYNGHDHFTAISCNPIYFSTVKTELLAQFGVFKPKHATQAGEPQPQEILTPELNLITENVLGYLG